jgi:UPF0755 protein
VKFTKQQKKKVKQYLTEFQLFKSKDEILAGSFLFALFFSILWIIFTGPVGSLETPHSIIIEKGDSLKKVSELLKEEEIIKSRTIFNSLVILKAGDDKVVFGEYLFNEKPNMFEVVSRITNGDYGIDTKSVTLYEGSTVRQMGNLLDDVFERFDKDVFYQLTEGKEGYLFPDTYIFLENAQAHEIIEVLESSFDERLSEINKEIKGSQYSLEDIVIMASIIEREATAESRQEVSNILWHRIEIDMPLQVDATFIPINGKGTFDLTLADLKEDNPYNTYVNKGLPPGPIANPGIKALIAAAHPEPTDNLYFLTGRDGEMYYAESFEGHVRNKNEYLY